MKNATAQRPAGAHDSLSHVLAAANAAARLAAFAATVGCNPLDVSADEGKSLDLLKVIDVMRARGYTVSAPVKPQAQVKPWHTTWVVSVDVKGCHVKLVFHIPQDAS